MSSIYDDVHREAMADYRSEFPRRNEMPEPYHLGFDDAPYADDDIPLFDFDPASTPAHVYEAAEASDLSHPCSTVTPNPCEGAA